ncbi:energy-coupling factor transporter transmembrane protein EcfT [Olsenella sp. HMSC062G07]|uniref:energy-coupling factor transporter transmembrane component T family protein n=1 Tax=Olsenella sp. HMSC062G07 TaxID=1739330 RepID=UPI000AE75C08|nr:energy-coupling factor transporter transmembrane component T [Olsenella sp. HMSC062G07]
MGLTRSFFLGSHLRNPCWLHEVDARAKLLALVSLSLATLLASRDAALGLLGALALAGVASCRVPPRAALRALGPALLVLVLVMLGHALVVDGSYDLRILGTCGVRVAGARAGAQAMLRICLLVTWVSLVSATTTSPQLGRALGWALRPLLSWGVPVGAVTTTVSIALRFIPEVIEEFDRIRLAQIARGARFDDRRVSRRLRSYAAVLVPLVASLFGRSDQLAEAMRDRGFTGGGTLMAPPCLAVRDLVVMLASVAAPVLVVLM